MVASEGRKSCCVACCCVEGEVGAGWRGFCVFDAEEGFCQICLLLKGGGDLLDIFSHLRPDSWPSYCKWVCKWTGSLMFVGVEELSA
jgi:hypothetical protein